MDDVKRIRLELLKSPRELTLAEIETIIRDASEEDVLEIQMLKRGQTPQALLERAKELRRERLDDKRREAEEGLPEHKREGGRDFGQIENF